MPPVDQRLTPLPLAHVRVCNRPAVIVTGCLLLFAAIWLIDLNATSLSPPTDNIEQLTWVHAIAWGYYKHPPFPTWLIWLPVRLFGATAAVSYGAGAACTLASLALMWNLLRRLRGDGYAAIALMASLCITYYNGRLYYYNHETVLMVMVAASASLYWQAYSSGRTRWWVALGVALGLGMLAKYQMAVAVACIGVFWVSQRGWRVLSQRRGLLLAGLVALSVFAPHIRWLQANDFGPIHYATASALGASHSWAQRWANSIGWLASQLLNRALPAWLLLGSAAWMHRRSTPKLPPSASTAAPCATSKDRALLLVWGLGGPICLVSGPPDASGVLALRLQDHPLVLIDGRFDQSPWVDPQLPRQCGVLRLREGPFEDGWTPIGAGFENLSWQVDRPVPAIVARTSQLWQRSQASGVLPLCHCHQHHDDR